MLPKISPRVSLARNNRLNTPSFPRRRESILEDIFIGWIPAYAGMTFIYNIVSVA